MPDKKFSLVSLSRARARARSDRLKGRERATEYPPTNSTVTKPSPSPPPSRMTGRPAARMEEGWGRRDIGGDLFLFEAARAGERSTARWKGRVTAQRKRERERERERERGMIGRPITEKPTAALAPHSSPRRSIDERVRA